VSRWTHYGILAVSLAVSAGAFAGFVVTTREADRARFANQVRTAEDRITDRLDQHVTMLVGARGLFVGGVEPTAEQFRAYVRSLEIPTRAPGIQGIGYSRPHAIVLLEPLDRRNQVAIGFDMSTEPVRRAAMERARDSGAPAASGRVTLVQEIDADKQPGFLLYVPVYRDAPRTVEQRRASLIGFVYSPFRVGDLFAGIFRERDPRVELEVFDGERIAPDTLLYRSRGDPDRRARRTSTRTVDVAGERWTIVYRSTPTFDAVASRRLLPWIAAILLGGNLALFLVTRNVVRARARADAERANLHALLTAAPAAIAILRGPDFRYELSNPINQALSRGRALPGRTIAEALPELEAQGITALARHVYETGEPYVGAEVPVRVEDEQKYLNGVYAPLRDGEGRVTGIMAFAYEVTDLVESRHRVEALAEELRRAVRARDDFLSIAGHELNTPLAALGLQLEGVRRITNLDPETLRARLDKAIAQVRRLEGLVGELLDVSRISAGRLTLAREPIDLRVLAGNVVERLAPSAARASCPVHLDAAPASGTWDPARLDQVITNLLTNAFKYGAGKAIDVQVGAADGLARLAVRDHGIGVPAEDRERIFRRFERAVSDRHYGGLGLGLWISRQIVEAHGGRIWAEPAGEEGTRFVVELPREATRSAAP